MSQETDRLRQPRSSREKSELRIIGAPLFRRDTITASLHPLRFEAGFSFWFDRRPS